MGGIIIAVVAIGGVILACILACSSSEKLSKEDMEKYVREHEEQFNNLKEKFEKRLEYYKAQDTFVKEDIGIWCIIENNKLFRLHRIIDDKSHYCNPSVPMDVPKDLKEEIINLDDIKYYKIKGEETEKQYISGGGGGGSSIGGAIVGELVAGDVGAIIGSRKKVDEIKTTYKMEDNRTLVITLHGGIEKTFGIALYEKLLDYIPEKEYDNYIENKKSKGKISV